ncbi:MAG: hypothetical protein IT449_15585 [Phycisphaerales bacterium]|nr:hypothetical protein [Phycisphaerales bacterium]
MLAKEIRELKDREPFRPFRLRLSSGDKYEIRDPSLVVPMKSEVFVASPKLDSWTVIPYLHVAAVEALPANGHAVRTARRK